jgi:hypothetical protein
MAHHPRTYKTSKELILPREIRYTTSKEIGVIEKKRPKLKHLLGLEHRNIPIQLDLWETRQYSGEKDKQHNTDTQDTRHEPR